MFNYTEAIETARTKYGPDPVSFAVLDGRFDFLKGKGGNVTSQYGEDGLIAAIFEKIGIANHCCFEVGAWDGLELSNTWVLGEDGWRLVLIEADDYRFGLLKEKFGHRATLVHERITRNSLDRILESSLMPTDMDLGVIDIDGQDWHVWDGMRNYRPRLMMVEFTGLFSPVPELGNQQGQAGMNEIIDLGKSKGYRAICKTSVNLFFVEERLLT